MPEEITNNVPEATQTTASPVTEATPATPAEEKTPDAQELMLEIAKLKRTNDKLSSEAAEYKRKWKDTLSVQEKASMEKAEAEALREEHMKQLEKENAVFKSEKSFVLLGYGEEQAHNAAVAQYDHDTETLFKIQKEVQDALIKKQQEEWLKTRPPIQTGGGNEPEDLFLKGFNSVKTRYKA